MKTAFTLGLFFFVIGLIIHVLGQNKLNSELTQKSADANNDTVQEANSQIAAGSIIVACCVIELCLTSLYWIIWG